VSLARQADNGPVDDAARAYIEAIPAQYRPLFDRVHRVILAAFPDAAVVISYGIPAYKLGRGKVYVGVWKHGLSVYGWPREHAAEFGARHPGLVTSKGTIQIRPQDAAGISDDEFRDLARAALER
jgi:uncharacterized protein YdhG (YjbR/CyaY superfamily)